MGNLNDFKGILPEGSNALVHRSLKTNL